MCFDPFREVSRLRDAMKHSLYARNHTQYYNKHFLRRKAMAKVKRLIGRKYDDPEVQRSMKSVP